MEALPSPECELLHQFSVKRRPHSPFLEQAGQMSNRLELELPGIPGTVTSQFPIVDESDINGWL
jgi:hypothetical protein